MSLLTIVQHFCERTGLDVPGAVCGSTSSSVLQMKALLEEEGQELSSRHAWEAITFEASHTTVAAEDQGAISTIASNGFDRVKNQTIWDRTDKLPVVGPLDARDWQTLKGAVSANPRYQFRIRGGRLLATPTPTAGHSWYFEYVSRNWILGADGTTYKEFFTLDTDTILLPEKLMLFGLRWRWKKEKGFEYAEDFRMYEALVKDAGGRDGSKPILRMDDLSYESQPMVYAPAGNWNLT